MTIKKTLSPLPISTSFGTQSTCQMSLAAEHLDDSCPGYLYCLGRAASENWERWSCSLCRFSGDQPDLPIEEIPLEYIARKNDQPVYEAALVYFLDLYQREAFPPVVVSQETYFDRHLVFEGTMILVVARILKMKTLKCVKVAVNKCPMCRQATVTIKGGCARCRISFVPIANGAVYSVPGHDYKPPKTIRDRAREEHIRRLSDSSQLTVCRTTGTVFSGHVDDYKYVPWRESQDDSGK